MKSIYYCILFLWFVNGCTNPTLDQDKNPNIKVITTSNFETYLTSLDNIPLPLKLNPSIGLTNLSKEYKQECFNYYHHLWSNKPLGVFFRNSKTIGIIDYSTKGDLETIPFLTTYDMQGNKIDSTGFYIKSGNDIGYHGNESITFNENGKIIVLDTIQKWDLNKEGDDIIEGSKHITTGKTVYTILENGKIRKHEK